MAKKKQKKIIALDGDKLGMIGGVLGATVVLVVGFLSQNSTLASTLIRMGWVFVACYGATFFLVRMILRTTLMEMIEEEKRIKEEKKKSNREAMEAEEAARTETKMAAMEEAEQ